MRNTWICTQNVIPVFPGKALQIQRRTNEIILPSSYFEILNVTVRIKHYQELISRKVIKRLDYYAIPYTT